jgi:hypothetical protein
MIKSLFISGMLITNGSRECVLKLKEYSDKKNSTTRRARARSRTSNAQHFDGNENPNSDPTSLTPLVSTAISSSNNIESGANQLNGTTIELTEDRSLLGRLLNCKPCRQMTDNQTLKNVC